MKITNALFRGNLQDLNEEERKDAIKDMEKIQAKAGQKLEDLMIETKVAKSKREAREWIKGNSIAINGIKVTDPNQIIDNADLFVENVLILRRGKKNSYCIELVEE